METVDKTSQETPNENPEENPQMECAVSSGNPGWEPAWVEPDLEFIERLDRQGADSLKKCFQCGTCSGTCTLTPDHRAFPSKEIAWAAWGMKDRLVHDPDVWLCYQCNDCSTRCPRNVRPGDVLGAIRQECIVHHAFPRFFARWVNSPQYIPLLIGIPTALLAGALALKEPVEEAFGWAEPAGQTIVFAYSSIFPHWLLNSFFFLFSFLALLAVVISVRRFWNGLKAADPDAKPVKGVWPSFCTVIKSVFSHDKFDRCDNAHLRFWAHGLVFFGFIALCLVTLWVITARINPLVQGDFIYPFGFFSPWKILANLGGLALIVGCSLLMFYRLLKDPGLTGQRLAGAGTYFDWALISTLLLVVFTGFFTEVLHYVRLEPHRHIVYFIHLVFVFMLLIYLPYSKLAHIVYRTTAQVYAEHMGRKTVSAGGNCNAKETT